MRGSAAAPNNGTPVRVKHYEQTAVTGATVTFDEGSALDSTYLLVAFVATADAGTPATITATGWTASTGGGTAYGVVRSYFFAHQGDGSLNSITVTASESTQINIILMAFPGFYSASSQANGYGQNNGGSGGEGTSFFTISGPSTTPTFPAGVSLVAVKANGSMNVTRSMTNGYTLLETSPVKASVLLGWKFYDDTSTYNTFADWASTPAYSQWNAVVYRLTP
jgi:hypothetical protein